jgi:hypothetical protein
MELLRIYRFYQTIDLILSLTTYLATCEASNLNYNGINGIKPLVAPSIKAISLYEFSETL